MSRTPSNRACRVASALLGVLGAGAIVATPATAGTIVYDDVSSVYTLADTGGTPVRIVRGGNWGMPSQPRWSPDGSRIAFVVRAATAACAMDAAKCPSEVGVMNADGSGVALITSSGGARNSDPSWSPDGQRIVFLRGGGTAHDGTMDAADIWSVRADGTGLQKVTSTVVSEGSPRTRADGRIDFEVWRPGQPAPEVWVMNADGSGRAVLIQGDFASYSYAYSRDGLRIAWGGTLDLTPPSYIYTMSADGTGITARTRLYGRWGGGAQVTWSDDGTAVLYRGTVPPGSDNDPPNLFRLDLTSGATPLNLTAYPRPAPPDWPSPTWTGDPSNPDWQGAKGAVSAVAAASPPDRRAPRVLLLSVRRRGGQLRGFAKALRYAVFDRSGIRSVRLALTGSKQLSAPRYATVRGTRDFRRLAGGLPKGTATFRFRTVDVRGNRATQVVRVRILG